MGMFFLNTSFKGGWRAVSRNRRCDVVQSNGEWKELSYGACIHILYEKDSQGVRIEFPDHMIG
jgi:hypothetical protein